MNVIFLMILSAIVVLGGTGLLSFFMGKHTKSGEDWAVGGRNLPIYVIIGTQYATAMGGGVLVAHVGIGYASGWSALTYGIFLSGTLLLLTTIADWLRKSNFTTVPEIFERLYGQNKLLISMTAIMTIIVPFGWICTQLVAFGKLYSSLTGFSMPGLIIVFAAVSLIYVLPAGLASVAWTDFIFGCLMILVSAVSLVYTLKMGGGIQTIVSNVPPEIAGFPSGMGAAGGFTILLWAFSILPGGLTNQMYYQRIYAVDNVKTVKTSLIISAVVVLSADVWATFMGLSIRSMNPNLAPEMAAGWFLTQVPAWFMALYSGFLVATIISTTDSAVQSIVVNLTRDFYAKIINTKGCDEKKMIKLSRILSVIVMALAVTLSLAFPHALHWLIATYAYSASALLFPIFLGYFMRDKNFLTVQGAIGSMFCGFGGCIIGHIVNTNIPYVVFGLIASLLGLVIISAITHSQIQSEESLDEELALTE